MLAPAPGLHWIPVRKVREQAAQVLAGWQLIRKSRKTPRLLSHPLDPDFSPLRLTGWNLPRSHKDTWAVGSFLQAAIFIAIESYPNICDAPALGIKGGIANIMLHFLGIRIAGDFAVSLSTVLTPRGAGPAFGFASIHVKRSKAWKWQTAGD